MAKLIMQAAAVIMAICMLVVVPHAEGQNTHCVEVSSELFPCESYLLDGGDVPEACCNGVRYLNKVAHTSFDRKLVCMCTKFFAYDFNIKDDKYAKELPAKCNVDNGFPASFFKTDCNSLG